ncbi:hypothetical protein [Methanosarcina sp. UBA5]|nr:hypothetical protein [Methanosarcina sp. UBA5]
MISALTVFDQLTEIIQSIKRPSRGRNLLFFSVRLAGQNRLAS